MNARQGLAIVWVGVVLALPSACELIQPEGVGEAVQRGVCQAPLNGGAGGMGGCGGEGGADGLGGAGGATTSSTTTSSSSGSGGAGGATTSSTTTSSSGSGGAGGAMMGCIPGSMCNDGNACTINDVCEQDGVTCVGTPKACDLPLPGSCVVPVAGTCNPATGLCATAPAPAGTSCNDSNLCTLGDTCNGAGSCVPGVPKDCTPGQCQVFISCTPITGVCNFGPAPLGAQCNDNDPCTSADVCTATGCAGTSSCAPSGPCDVATCNAQAGCTHSVAADGTACANMDQCTAGVCVSGACTVVNQLNCDQPGDCQLGPGSCVVGQGCVYPQAPDSTPCGVNDLCASGACQAGACVQTPVTCPPPQDPCSVAYCDTAVGCTSASQSGLACDDANPCTTSDACATNAQGVVACGGVAQLDGVPCMLAGEAGVCIAGTCFISPELGTGGSGGGATTGAGGGQSGAGGGAGTGGAGGGPAPGSPQSVPIRLFGGGCAASGEGGDRRGAGLLGLVLLGLLAARRRATSGGS